ncbi:hypothetical protein M433DRAFT_70660 [Acidomyces richmondensis BFW]|nr:MAG: hypothetical protein FE78DRAFT_152814 [Acidomyces sp. 'richmondensis']KYG43904.1 hypothetical protein M433DRAFT_70660 [Acidomyces richmondensis BFW]
MLSPPHSSVASVSSHAATTLPHPRSSPLRPGGTKESAFIRYVDQRIQHMQRRFAKRTNPAGNGLSDVDKDKADDWGDVKGYSTMREACRDIEELLELVWISGTPSLQIPFLINLAVLLSTVISAMPPSPNSLFRVLKKFDLAFTSLIQSRDLETGETLPGFEGKRGISVTEKVRIRSLVERTRVEVMEAFKRGEFAFEEPEGEAADKAENDDNELMVEREDMGPDEEDGEDSCDMQLARVYDRTLQELGDSLEEPSIGIITEKWGQ